MRSAILERVPIYGVVGLPQPVMDQTINESKQGGNSIGLIFLVFLGFSADKLHFCRNNLFLQKQSFSAEYSTETEYSVIWSHRNWFLCFCQNSVSVVH